MASQVEQIKEKLGIADVVGQYIKLEKAGSNFKARCPFHNEKTPSFFVSPARNSFYCFGCNAKGDIFSFVEQFEGLDFVGALKILGEKAGVQIVFEASDKKDERTKSFAIMATATLFFEENLKKQKKVIEYLKDRGFKEGTINDWRIGYAGNSWNDLYEHLKKTYSTQEIEKTGLIKKKESGSEYYDRFRSRIMFPIFDNSGRIVAFSGRIFTPLEVGRGTRPRLLTGFKDDGKSAKYINSPETILFSKSKILYGLDRAKFSIRKLNFSIIVEGQMDLLASHQAGFTNTVALSGTALTVEHMNLLKRMSENVVLAFDADSAGLKASIRAGKIALSLGMDVKLVSLPNEIDPADLILREGQEGWRGTIRNSKHIIEFLLEKISENIPDKRKAGKEIKEKLPDTQFFIPDLKYTTDNAAMIASAGYFRASKKKFTPWQKLTTDANLEL